MINYKERYTNYIQSSEWEEKSKDFIMEVGYCESCGNTEELECHHLSYKNLGHETRKDIIVLCDNCHSEEHLSQIRKKYDTKKDLDMFQKEARFREILSTLPPTLQSKIKGKEMIVEEDKPKLIIKEEKIVYSKPKIKHNGFSNFKSFIEGLKNSIRRFFRK